MKIFPKILSTVLLVTFFLNTNYVIMYYGVFKLNQNILAETVCENKTADCKGCCYLKKKIEQESKDEQSASELLKNKQKLSEFFVNTSIIIKPTLFSGYNFPESNLLLLQGEFSAPVKPPQFS